MLTYVAIWVLFPYSLNFLLTYLASLACLGCEDCHNGRSRSRLTPDNSGSRRYRNTSEGTCWWWYGCHGWNGRNGRHGWHGRYDVSLHYQPSHHVDLLCLPPRWTAETLHKYATSHHLSNLPSLMFNLISSLSLIILSQITFLHLLNITY